MNKIIEKSDLVSIAADLFRQKGYSGTSIDDIAKKVGLTKGSLYHHFAGKEELALAAVAQVHAHYRANIFSILLDRKAPGVDDLAEFNRAVEDFFANHPYGCLLANMSLEIGGAYELFKKVIVRFFDEWTSCYRKIFSRYLSKKAALAEAEDAIAAVQGSILMYRIRHDLEPLRRQHAKLLRICKAKLPA